MLYWTCNNIFSLVKNIFYKLKHPRRVINVLCPVLGILFEISLIITGLANSRKKLFAVTILALFSFIPFILTFI